MEKTELFEMKRKTSWGIRIKMTMQDSSQEPLPQMNAETSLMTTLQPRIFNSARFRRIVCGRAELTMLPRFRGTLIPGLER